MKSFTANLQTEHEKDTTTLTGCLKIVRKDSTEYLYTSHDRDIVVNMTESWDGTYLATYAFTPSSFNFTSDLAVDNFDITNVIDNTIVKEIDIINDLFNGAEVWYFTCNHSTSTGEVTATDGINKVFHGFISNIEYTSKKYLAEVRSLSTKLTKQIGDVYSKTCRTTLGTAKCGIVLEPDVWVYNTVYALGDYVRASVYDDRRYECTTAGTSNSADVEPTWITTIDVTTNEAGDGTCVWTAKDAYTKEVTVTPIGVYARYFRINIDDTNLAGYRAHLAEWQGRNGQDINEFVSSPTTDSGHYSTDVSSRIVDGNTGTSWISDDTSMPEWVQIDLGSPKIIEDYRFYVGAGSGGKPKSWTITASLNDIDWLVVHQQINNPQANEAWTEYWELTNGPAIPAGTGTGNKSLVISDVLRNYADNYFKYGTVTWLTGNNAGTVQEVKRSIQATGVVEFYLPTNYDIETSDTFKIRVGCNRMYLGSDGTEATGNCKTKYNNLINFRGEPFIPSEDILIGGSGTIDKA